MNHPGVSRPTLARRPLRGRSKLRLESLEERRLLATLTLTPTQDATLIQDTEGALANGAGQHLFAGRTAQPRDVSTRRALIQFELPAELASANITDVTLRLHMSRAIESGHTVSIHAVDASWGEGSADADRGEGRGTEADAGSATWLHRRFDEERWDSPGGDFSDAIATTFVEAIGFHEWSSAELMDDVIEWQQAPELNFGWLMLGDESSDSTAKRFDSREHPNLERRPQLIVEYDVNAHVSWQNSVLPYDVDGDGHVLPVDVLRVINELNGVGMGLALGELPPISDTIKPSPFVDVSGDNRLEPIDALLVINELNRPVSHVAAVPAITGESETVNWLSVDFAAIRSALATDLFFAVSAELDKERRSSGHRLGR